MEPLLESESTLKRLEATRHSGNVGEPKEIVRLDRQMKELKKKIRALE